MILQSAAREATDIICSMLFTWSQEAPLHDRIIDYDL